MIETSEQPIETSEDPATVIDDDQPALLRWLRRQWPTAASEPTDPLAVHQPGDTDENARSLEERVLWDRHQARKDRRPVSPQRIGF
jgi:hypothetical protein